MEHIVLGWPWFENTMEKVLLACLYDIFVKFKNIETFCFFFFMNILKLIVGIHTQTIL